MPNWKNLRTTNAIGSMIAAGRLRDRRTSGSWFSLRVLGDGPQASRGRCEETVELNPIDHLSDEFGAMETTPPLGYGVGQWISFGLDRDGDWEIYCVRPDGSGLRQLADDPAFDGDPNWVPAGFGVRR